MQDPTYILPAEWFGTAEAPDGILNIGGVRIPIGDRHADIYVRRDSKELSIIEVHWTRHDGLAQEQLDHQNDEAANDPRGPKEYWREQMVGHYRYGDHLMTDEDFEEDWNDD